MSSMTFGQKALTVIPPMKGSFPLDHEGECKLRMLQYMNCMNNASSKTTNCRQQCMDYLDCRMDRSLMLREDWTKLGFKEDEIKEYYGKKDCLYQIETQLELPNSDVLETVLKTLIG